MHKKMQSMTQAQFEQSHVTDRCILAIHDYGTRRGPTRAKVMRQLRTDGFTAFDISEAARKMGADDQRPPAKRP